MAQAKTKINEKNLVFLLYASNPCYVRCTDQCPEDVTVDLEKGTWQVERSRYRAYYGEREYKIGERRHESIGNHSADLTIGVYDRTNIGHLNSMVHDTREATFSSEGAICMD